MRRRFLVALAALVLWTLGYVVYAVINTLRPTGPEEPRVREDAGEDPGEQ